MRKKILAISAFSFLALTACSTLHSSLEYNTFANFKVEEITTEPVTLKLSGLSMNSALAIREIKQVYNEDALDIYVEAWLVDGKAGVADLNYIVVVPAFVKEVRFGKERKVIWQRNNLSEK